VGVKLHEGALRKADAVICHNDSHFRLTKAVVEAARKSPVIGRV
jgi:hypothetical protein